jgi:hypothetical protein
MSLPNANGPARSSLPPGHPETECPAKDTVADKRMLAKDADTSRDALVSVSADVLTATADLIGTQGDRERAAERRGYRRGHQDGRAEGYAAGYLEAIAEIKEINQDLVASLELELLRWPPSGRGTFGRPRPGDFKGGSFPLEHPGEVYLGGAAVHRPMGCTAACRAHEKGWYSPAEAIAILRGLPHDYTEAIDEIRAMARAVAA